MATSAPKEAFEWLVILPDQAGKYEKRMEVRPKHFEGLNSQRGTEEKPGFMLMGGALLEEVPKEGEPLKIVGSIVVTWATSREEVIEKLKTDIYAKNEVWDFEKAQIYPFKRAFSDLK